MKKNKIINNKKFRCMKNIFTFRFIFKHDVIVGIIQKKSVKIIIVGTHVRVYVRTGARTLKAQC